MKRHQVSCTNMQLCRAIETACSSSKDAKSWLLFGDLTFLPVFKCTPGDAAVKNILAMAATHHPAASHLTHSATESEASKSVRDVLYHATRSLMSLEKTPYIGAMVVAPYFANHNACRKSPLGVHKHPSIPNNTKQRSFLMMAHTCGHWIFANPKVGCNTIKQFHSAMCNQTAEVCLCSLQTERTPTSLDFETEPDSDQLQLMGPPERPSAP